MKNISIEIKSACGKPEFKKGAKFVLYAPAPQPKKILENCYIFSRNGFLGMIQSYDGNMIHSKTGNIQSFHWIDCTGLEYRPKASRKIERHIQSYVEYAPTLKDLFEVIGIDFDDFDNEVETLVDEFLERRGCKYDGAFGEALEVAIKRHLMKRSKYLDRKTPNGVRYGDAQIRIEMSAEELSEMLGIE